MEPIPVPAPPKSSFNKNRPVSDLLHSQLQHFQHVAKKQHIAIDPALSRDIHTEAGAARYITQITRAIRGQSQAATPSGIAVVPSAPPTTKAAPTPAGGLALAAAAAPPLHAKKSKKKSSKRKKS